MAGMLSATFLVSAAVLLTSCAYWPDDLNPSDWYSAVAGEEAAPGADEDYPNLSEVPEAPGNVSSPEEIHRIAQSLVADQVNARHMSDIVRADDETSPAVVPVPTEVPGISHEDPGFDELPDASGPDATLQTRTAAAAGSPTTVINDPTFTTAGNALLSEMLVAIIGFGRGSSALGQKEREIVARLAALHRQTGGRIRLIGHASRSVTGLADAEREPVNFKVSLDRATAVADELIRNGVSQGDILIEAAADDSAMAEAAGIVDEAGERRVEVYFGA
ncbi:MAG: OmpA family protein [Rhodospirillales bacterium]|nr:OmpA family protein [Rhodospirillales bacterium]